MDTSRRDFSIDEVKALLAAGQGKRKYRNQPTRVDGFAFASRKEAKRYLELKCLADLGHITALVLQVAWPILVNGVRVCTYVSDFEYYDQAGALVVEDVKGVRTRLYALKRKLMAAVHGIVIKES